MKRNGQVHSWVRKLLNSYSSFNYIFLLLTFVDCNWRLFSCPTVGLQDRHNKNVCRAWLCEPILWRWSKSRWLNNGWVEDEPRTRQYRRVISWWRWRSTRCFQAPLDHCLSTRLSGHSTCSARCIVATYYQPDELCDRILYGMCSFTVGSAIAEIPERRSLSAEMLSTVVRIT